MSVLAWLDSLHTTEADGAVTNRKWPEAQEARAAVAELVEALSEFDGMAEPSMPGTPPKLRRLREAFARVQGGAA